MDAFRQHGGSSVLEWRATRYRAALTDAEQTAPAQDQARQRRVERAGSAHGKLDVPKRVAPSPRGRALRADAAGSEVSFWDLSQDCVVEVNLFASLNIRLRHPIMKAAREHAE